MSQRNGVSSEGCSQRAGLREGVTGNYNVDVGRGFTKHGIAEETSDQVGVAATTEKVAELGKKDDVSTCLPVCCGRVKLPSVGSFFFLGLLFLRLVFQFPDAVPVHQPIDVKDAVEVVDFVLEGLG